MGMWFTFVCPACGYEATVSGGPDVGMSCTTLTIHCKACQVIGDVVTKRFEFQQWPTEEDEAPAALPECPADPSHEVVAWSSGGPCPKCGTAMEQDDAPVMWD